VLYTYVRSVGARYFGVMLAVAGCNTAVPLVAGFSQISIRKASKRSFTSALVVAAGGLGGIASGLAFTQKQAPHYSTGVHLTLAMASISIAITLIQTLYFRFQNGKADRGELVIEDHADFRRQL
jgi:cytochrome c biogenesis factor